MDAMFRALSLSILYTFKLNNSFYGFLAFDTLILLCFYRDFAKRLGFYVECIFCHFHFEVVK